MGAKRWRRAAAAGVAGLLVALVLARPGGPAPAAAQPGAAPLAAVPEELALVPADAVAFAHVRLADVWGSELFAGVRETFARAGPKALAALDKLSPPPSAFDRLTAFVVMGDREPQPFFVVSFSQAVDKDAVVATVLPGNKPKQVGGKTVYAGAGDSPHGLVAYFPSDRHVVVAESRALDAYLARPVAAEGNMKKALALAAVRPVVAAVNLAALPIPWGELRDLPPPLLPLLKAQTVQLTMGFGAATTLAVEAGYATPAAAADAEKALGEVKKMAKAETAKLRADLEAKLAAPPAPAASSGERYAETVAAVLGLGSLSRADALIDDPGVRRSEAALSLDVTLPNEVVKAVGGYAGVGVGLLLPAVYKVRVSAERIRSLNNLKLIGIAIHSYESANGKLPANVVGKDGKPLLSWRVRILPYIEQAALYERFKLDEPWDSPANRAASQTWVPTFVSPNVPPAPLAGGYAATHYKGVAGPGTVFDPKGNIRITDIADGTSNTVMVIETTAAVPWAKPDDFEFDPAKPLPPSFAPGRPPINVLMGDGSVRAVDPAKVSEKTLKAAFTRAGGEVLGNW